MRGSDGQWVGGFWRDDKLRPKVRLRWWLHNSVQNMLKLGNFKCLNFMACALYLKDP